MCGLFGIFPEDATSSPDVTRLRQSGFAIRHRGPDAGNILSEPGLGLAHQRLSLVDTDTRSDQPFTDPSGRYILVYNGEVYNFRTLRAELEALGIPFRTTSDTEVVLHSLIQWGEDALARFDGMFGLAFIDRQTHRVLLARDRFGMKPLYWMQGMTEQGPAFLFGSEIKAFEPWITLQPDVNSIAAYLMKFGGPTSGPTFYQGIRSLTPGTYLWHDGSGNIDTASFFHLTDFLDLDEMTRLDGLSAADIVDEYADLMHKSVASHLFADAPVGAFCSGGVDSSLIVAIAAAQHQNIALFHANVKGAWSEVDAASELAKSLKLDLHVIEAEEQDFVDMIPRVMRHYEYPFSYHPNCAPLMMIAQLAADSGIKGLLSGEGSDELFLGYPWLGRKRLTDGYERMISGLGSAIRAIPGVGPILAPDRMGNMENVRDILNGREMAQDKRAVADSLAQLPRKFQERGRQWSLDYMHHHLRTLLHRNDTMGMAAGIEARFPFLDTQVARFGVNLPARYKLRASPFVFEKAHPFIRDKWVVREVANRYIPNTLSQRIKIGFWTTVFQRLEIRPEYFRNAHLGDLFSLTRTQMTNTIEEAGPDLRLRLLLTEVWLRCRLDHQDEDREINRLRDHVSIRPDRFRPRPSSANKPVGAAVHS